MAAPTDITISPKLISIAENTVNGTFLADLTAVDADATIYVWSLVDNAGGRFAVSGSQLIVANQLLLDYDVQQLYSIIVRVTEGGVSLDREFTVRLNDVSNETLTGSSGSDRLTAGVGSDRFSGAGGTDVLSTGAGDDTLDGGAGADTMKGGAGNDLYFVDSSSDIVIEEPFSGGGVDTVRSSATFTLGNYVDHLTLVGGSDINATGNIIANVLVGNSGDNTIDGKAGNDTMIGGGGNDSYIVDSSFDVITEGASAGIDRVTSSASYVLGANIEYLTLTGKLAIAGTGNSSANTILGNEGGNALDGAGGNDDINGGLGNDTITGGGGNDSLTGGAGADMFLFASAPNATTNVDTITDFTVGSDTIRFSKAAFAKLDVGSALSASAFVAGTAATSASSRIIYDEATGNLFYDADGTGAAAAVKVAELSSKPELTAASISVALLPPTLTLGTDSGASSRDTITNSGTINVSGLIAGGTWQYTTDNGTTWKTGVGSSFTLTGDGVKSVIARQTDQSGRISPTSKALAFTLDTVDPTETVSKLALSSDTGISDTDFITRIASQSITGELTSALAAGSVVRVSLDNGTTWQTAAANAGSTTFSLIGVTLAGSDTIKARVEDAAGNASATMSRTYSLDTSVPTERVSTVAFSQDSGTSATDLITNVASQTITGTLNAPLAAGSYVRISLDDGATWRTATAAVGSTTFSLGGVTLTGADRLIARVEDIAGSFSTAVNRAYILDTSSATPGKALAFDSGASSIDKITNSGVVTIAGVAEDSTWQYSTNGGTTWNNGTGTSFTLNTDGLKNVIVRQIDVAGNISPVSTPLTFTLDRVAATPVLSLTHDTGVSATDLVTNDGAVTVQGIELGADWQYSLDNGSTWLTGPDAGIVLTGNGAKSVIVRQFDAAGNQSDNSNTLTFTLDSTELTAPTIALVADNGISSSDKITNNGTINVSGLTAGASWQYSTNGGTSWTNGTGTSVTLSGDGAKTVIVRQTNLAGSVSPTSDPISFTLDTTVATPILSLLVDNGPSSTDLITSIGTVKVTGIEPGVGWQYSTNGGSTWTDGTGTSFTLTGDGAKSVIARQTDAAGNLSANSAALNFTLETVPEAPALALATDTGISASDKATNAGTVNVSGLEVGATWQYSTNGGSSWTTGSGTSFTLTGDGAKSVIVRQELLGNTSPSSAPLTFTLDSVAPADTVATLAFSADNGASATDFITNASAQTISGTLSTPLTSGHLVRVSLDNGANWQTATASTGSTAFTMSGVVLTGSGTLIVRVEDMAGNAGPAVTQAYTLDLVAPTKTIATLAFSADTGSSATDFVTQTATQTITGTLSSALASNESVRISLDNGATWQSATASIGSTSFTLAGVTLSGASNLLVHVQDLAGNLGTQRIQAFAIDSTAATPLMALGSDSGTSTNDGITNSGIVNVTGVEPGASWQYSTNGGSSWITGSGTSVALTGEGAKSVIVRQTDLAGNTSASSAPLAFTLDTTIAMPALTLATDSGTSTSDKITNVGTINIAGLEAGATWRYSLNGGATWTAETGTSFFLNGDGAKSVIVEQTDQAGNARSNATPFTFTLDTSTVTPTLELATDSGSSASDMITKVGTVNVAGLEAGAAWEYSTNGGSTWTSGSGSSFTLTGNGANSVIVRQSDIAGNLAATSAALDFTLDTVAPTEAVFNANLSADTGVSATDRITKTAAQTVFGTLNALLDAGSSVKVSMDNGATWQTATASVGSANWSLAGLTLAGSNTMIVRVEDVAGNFSTALTQAYVLDTVAPTAAVTTTAFSADSGSSAADFITKTAAQTITGTLGAAIAAGDIVKVSLDNGFTWQTAAASVGSSSYSLSGVTLTGSNTMIVRVEDVAGNFSTAKTQAYVLDTTAPTEAVSTVDISADTGTSASDFLTKTAAQTITGTLSTALATGNTVKVSLDNGGTWQTATASVGSTSYSLSGVTLVGSNTLQVRVEDVAGNFSTVKTQAYTLDTTAPTEAVTSVSLSADTGSSSSDFITKTTTQSLAGSLSAPLVSGNLIKVSLDNGATWQNASGTVGLTTFGLSGLTLTGADTMIVRVEDAAGNFSTQWTKDYVLDTTAVAPSMTLMSDTGTSTTDKLTNLGTVSVAGLETGASWQYSTNGGTNWTNGSGTSFTLTGDGSKSAMVRQTDLAGNLSAASPAFAFTLDGTIAVPGMALATDSGTSAGDKITKVGTVNVSSIEAGATWRYSLNGGSTWTNGSGTSLTLTGDGSKSVTVEQTDTAGNTRTSSAPLAFTLDTVAATPTLALAADTGISGSDKITNSGLVNVSGLEAGATWQYNLNAGTNWTAGTGTSFTLTGTGAKSVIVRQTDTAGNVSSNSATLDFTLDVTAPAKPAVGLATDSGFSSSDRITNVGTVNVTGLEAGGNWTYSTDGGVIWTVGSGTSFALTSDGTYSVVVKQVDTAGNPSLNSTAVAITRDTTAAILNSIAAGDNVSSTSETLTFKFSEQVKNFAASDVAITSISSGSVVKGTLTDLGMSAGIHTFTLTITKSVGSATFTASVANGAFNDLAGNLGTGKSVAGLKPAGAAGSPINLALDALEIEHVEAIMLEIENLPDDWQIVGGTRLSATIWRIAADDVDTISVITPSGFTGAAVLDMVVTAHHTDGTTSIIDVANNIEAYAVGSPIFAWSGHDNLTGSVDADMFVFADPIATDVVYAFDAEHDTVDLIGFAGFTSFDDVARHLADDASGSAVLTLGEGKSIRFDGVHAADLSADNFVFNHAVEIRNDRHIEIGNGAVLPFSGHMHNTGTIALSSAGAETLLQVIQKGLTLTGSGRIVMSDDTGNLIDGTVDGVMLTNLDNTISGAGQIGSGRLSIVNHGDIIADGTHILRVHGGEAGLVNFGTLVATGDGGLRVESAIDNDGTVSAIDSTVTIAGLATGDGTYLLSGHSILAFGKAASGDIVMADDANATLQIAREGLDGMISGFDGNDRIVIDGLTGMTALSTYATQDGMILNLTAGTRTLTLTLSGQYFGDGFALSSDDQGHSVLTYVPPTRMCGTCDVV